jgi:putative transposase
MSLTLQLQLFPDEEQAEKLKFTIEQFWNASLWLAKQAFEVKTANKITLQKRFYFELREKFRLPAQMASICIRYVGDLYRRDKTVLPILRTDTGMPFDNRVLSFKGIDRISILTLEGRLLVPFMMIKYQAQRYSHAKGQSDLVRRADGVWFLLVTVDLPEGSSILAKGSSGIDLDDVNSESDGRGFSENAIAE